MKHLTILLLVLLSLIACDSDDNNCTGIDCLPPITQTGAGIFGCLVNGKPFVDNSGSFNCFYQLVDGEYFFSIRGRVDNSYPRSIKIGTFKLQLSANSTFDLIEEQEGNAYASVIFNTLNNSTLNTDTTDSVLNGTLEVTRFDFSQNIISATFEFTALDSSTGDIYEITNGRFDSIFTQ